ncbi:MAG: UDP-N-acetylglucosamine 2-epimerase [bacterium]|nr:UDP-N-acetylglucosamine 2-epimerase [bacterium]
MRKICVITGSRAEYGLLSPVMRAIQEHPNLELLLIVTGMHLLERFGYTVDEIKKDEFRIDAQVSVSEDDSSTTFGEAVIGISKAIKRISPDFVLVLGDRFEALAGAIAGAANNVPVAHIHGGDVTTSGHIDESIRYALTNFAHLHFAATGQSASRIKRLGEEEWRIHLVGSPALDAILSADLASLHEEVATLRLALNKPIVVVVQHPVSLEFKEAGWQMEQTMLAIKHLCTQTIVIYPNSDPGSKEMIEVIERYRGIPNIQIYQNLNHPVYLRLLRIASVLVGNSSSGIIEAPSFGLPVVNVGSRNVGREHAENVIFVDYDKDQVLAGIKRTLFDEEFRERVKNCTNPYGDGTASQRIVEVLANIPIDKKLLKKQWGRE